MVGIYNLQDERNETIWALALAGWDLSGLTGSSENIVRNKIFSHLINFLGTSLLHQHDVTVNVITQKAATASHLQIKAEPNDNGVLDMQMETNAQALATSTPTRAVMATIPSTYSSCSRADESLQLLSSVNQWCW